LQGFDHVSLIEAANEREEASALAAAMRRALEPRPGIPEPTAALVTPDRNLARRVVTELARYGIEANDSGGSPLTSSLQGGLVPGWPFTSPSHRATPWRSRHCSSIRSPVLAFPVLRQSSVPALSSGSPCAAAAGRPTSRISRRWSARAKPGATKRHAPRWLQRIEDDEAGQARDFAARAAAALAPLTSLLVERAGPGVTNEIPIGRLAALTADALERICIDETGALDALWGDEAGVDLAAMLLETRDSGSTLEHDRT
jgi:ATP-dependent helicase/nuclease subunit B